MDESERKKQVRVREPPSVPFLWEARPGIPKKDWKPEPSSSSSSSSVSQIPVTPIKLIVSVPFSWEEKPGKPISHFSLNAEAKLIDMASSSSSSSPYWAERKESSGDNDYEDGSEQNESSSSPASENGSSTSSYETGGPSLVGASFLESLFPLFPPNSSFLEKAGSATPIELKSRDFDGEEDNSSVMLRRPPTLGELIMLSRRRSCRRKSVQMKNWDLQRNVTKKEAFGCFIFASSCEVIEGLLKRKFLRRLKLV